MKIGHIPKFEQEYVRNQHELPPYIEKNNVISKLWMYICIHRAIELDVAVAMHKSTRYVNKDDHRLCAKIFIFCSVLPGNH